jgi:hypothetical protein
MTVIPIKIPVIKGPTFDHGTNTNHILTNYKSTMFGHVNPHQSKISLREPQRFSFDNPRGVLIKSIWILRNQL